MKFLKVLINCLFWLLILTLMLAPLGMIWMISQHEMAQYTAPEAPVLQEVSIGTPASATRQDVTECITVDGQFTSFTWAYQELDQRRPDQIRWLVNVGDEIQEGQVIGSYNGEDIIAEQTGILMDRNSYSGDAYLRYQLFTPVVLSCRVDDRVLAVLKLSEGLTTEAGETVTLVFSSSQKNADGTTDVRLQIESDRYQFGQELDDLRILTGRVYQNVIVLPSNCVYQKDRGEDQPWYVRQVTENGLFLSELEVKPGYSDGDLICVSGISEGGWYDTGYKAVTEGKTP